MAFVSYNYKCNNIKIAAVVPINNLNFVNKLGFLAHLAHGKFYN